MGKMLLGQHLDAIAGTTADAGGGPLADTVDGENGRLIKGRWKKCRGSVRLVMFRKENLSVEMELIADDLFDPHFAFDPDRHRFEEGSETARRAGEIGGKKPLTFEERFLVERDKIDIFRGGQFTLRQTGADRVDRKFGVVFFPGKTFLLCGSDDFAVTDEACGAIVVKSRYAKNVHGKFWRKRANSFAAIS